MTDTKLECVYFDLLCCLKEIPYHLSLPKDWTEINENKETIQKHIKEHNLPEDIKGTWIQAYFAFQTGNYWADQEDSFVKGMRLVDSCNYDNDTLNGNCLFYKLEDHVEVFAGRGKRSIVVE